MNESRNTAKTALFIGWTGHRNLGDELMAACLRWCALERWGYDDAVFMSRYNQTFPGLTARALTRLLGPALHYRLADRRLRSRAAQAAGLFFGGGNIFHSANSSQWKRKLARAFRRAHPDAPCAAIGIGLGPFRDSKDRDACRAALQCLDSVLVRDQGSFDTALELDLEVPVLLGADPALLLDRVFPELTAGRSPSGTVSWILRPDKPGNEARLPLAVLGEAMRRIASSGLRNQMVVFNSDQGSPDLPYAEEAMQRIDRDILLPPLVFDGTNLVQTLKVVRDSSVVVASRLHGMVTAFALGVPCVSLSYHPKCDAFASDAGFPEEARLDLNAVDGSALAGAVQAASRRHHEGAGVDSVLSQRTGLLLAHQARDMRPRKP